MVGQVDHPLLEGGRQVGEQFDGPNAGAFSLDGDFFHAVGDGPETGQAGQVGALEFVKRGVLRRALAGCVFVAIQRFDHAAVQVEQIQFHDRHFHAHWVEPVAWDAAAGVYRDQHGRVGVARGLDHGRDVAGQEAGLARGGQPVEGDLQFARGPVFGGMDGTVEHQQIVDGQVQGAVALLEEFAQRQAGFQVGLVGLGPGFGGAARRLADQLQVGGGQLQVEGGVEASLGGLGRGQPVQVDRPGECLVGHDLGQGRAQRAIKKDVRLVKGEGFAGVEDGQGVVADAAFGLAQRGQRQGGGAGVAVDQDRGEAQPVQLFQERRVEPGTQPRKGGALQAREGRDAGWWGERRAVEGRDLPAHGFGVNRLVAARGAGGQQVIIPGADQANVSIRKGERDARLGIRPGVEVGQDGHLTLVGGQFFACGGLHGGFPGAAHGGRHVAQGFIHKVVKFQAAVVGVGVVGGFGPASVGPLDFPLAVQVAVARGVRQGAGQLLEERGGDPFAPFDFKQRAVLVQTRDGGHHPGRHAVYIVKLDAMLFEQGVESVGFVDVAGCVFAQGVISIELPNPFGEGRFGVFAGQLEQVLVAPDDRRRPGEQRRKRDVVKHLFDAFEQDVDVLLDVLDVDTLTGDAHQPA